MASNRNSRGRASRSPATRLRAASSYTNQGLALGGLLKVASQRWITWLGSFPFESQWGEDKMAQQAKTGEGHPADTLGTALVRATGILSALTSCQDTGRGAFAVNEQFLVQAVAALEGFVNDARNAYFDLCNTCDLSLTTSTSARAVQLNTQPQEAFDLQEEQAIFVSAAAPEAQVPLPDLYAFRKAIEGEASLNESASLIVDPDLATSYEDLLRKLTAVEVFAAERGRATTDQNSPLLPLLKSLRQDIERFRAA